MDHLPIGIAVNSVNSPVEFHYMNDKFPEIYRTTRQALTKPDAFWKVVYEDPGYRQKIKKRVLDDCDSGDPDRMYWEDIPFTRGGEGPFYICARNISLPESQLMISTVWDVTQRKLAEETLIKHQNLLIETQHITGVGGWEFNPATQKIFWTDEVYRIYGVTKDYDPSDVEQDVQFYAPSDQEKINDAFRQLVENGTPFDLELQFITAQDQQKWVRTVGRAEYDNGNIVRAFGNIMDITERKLAENQIRDNLEEKNVMLAEIHHRVKNNMAIITSLLELQTEFVDIQKDTENLLLDTKNRIQSMAMVHELVYETSNFAEISTDKLLQRLTGHLDEIYRAHDKNISIRVQSDPIMLDVNKSVPFTLLANEVISNAFKHAFTDRNTGSINVSFEVEKNGYQFVVADNGKGVPDHGQLNNPKSLGFTIIQGLAHQLKGQLEFTSPPEGGLRVILWFPGMTKY